MEGTGGRSKQKYLAASEQKQSQEGRGRVELKFVECGKKTKNAHGRGNVGGCGGIFGEGGQDSRGDFKGTVSR